MSDAATSALATPTTNDQPRQHELDQLKRKIEQLQDIFLKRGNRKPHIVILGAGYAGLTAALGLQVAEADVTLVNKNSHHTLTTLLHKPALGPGNFSEVTANLVELLQDTGIRLQLGEVTGINTQTQTVQLQDASGPHLLPYDFLVVALGGQPEYYNISGLEENAFALGSLSEVARIHLHVEETLIDFKENPDEPWRAHIVIGGAGLTGVGLAGELAEMANSLARTYGLKREQLRITLLDAAATVLADWADSQGLMISAATKALRNKGVRLLTETQAHAIRPNEVVLQNGAVIKAGLIVWVGGVRGHRIVEQSGLALNKQKRALVNGYMQAQDHPEIFVVGDSAAGQNAQGGLLPPTAQVAMQHGPAVAENFLRLFKGKPLLPCYPKQNNTFISIGRNHAIGVINNLVPFYGDDAKFLKNAIGYRYLKRLGGWRLVFNKLFSRHAPVQALKPKPSIPFGLRLGNATLAGMVGTAVLTAYGFIVSSFGMSINTPAMLSQAFSLTIWGGWLVHAWVGVLLAWILAFGFDYPLRGPMAAKGAVVGFLAFVLAQAAVVPMMGGGVFFSAVANGADLVFASLVAHLLYGLVTGWVYGETLNASR